MIKIEAFVTYLNPAEVSSKYVKSDFGQFQILKKIALTKAMTTDYNRSVAVEQICFVAPDGKANVSAPINRLTIGETTTVVDLLGFGVERKQKDAE